MKTPNILTSLRPNILPKHIAVVMDGNGRWAQQRGLPRVAGHEKGAQVAEDILKMCGDKRIGILTLFAFSSENWQRPSEEVNFLMELFLQTLQEKTPKLHENNIQLRFIGDYYRFNPELQKNILAGEQLTANNTGLKLNIAVNYSGRWDIVEATRKISEQIAAGNINASQLTPAIFAKYLSLADLPDPDLLIRTGGEQRISNFMLWQFAYTEFYFTEIYWPDFNLKIFEEALTAYANRQRRFGKTGEQVLLTKNEKLELNYEY